MLIEYKRMRNPISRIKDQLRSKINLQRAGARGKARVFDWLQQMRMKKMEKLSDASFDLFTYHGEDGIILYLVQQLQHVPGLFVDIGAGNGIKGNCTNLAVHFNWNGIFVDKSKEQLSTGKEFYQKTKTEEYPKFVEAVITPSNINQVLTESGIPSDIGLLSIDIDGNDYWIWKAISVVHPRIVVIEAKVEFGLRNVVVPYGENNSREFDIRFNGASVEALRLLGEEKGYKLVGANKQGYNLFFVQASEDFPATDTKTLMDDPLIRKSFYPDSFFARYTFAQ